MKNLIKVINPEKAALLKSQGFNYITEQINGQTVYVFQEDDSLKKALYSAFAKNDYFMDNKLRY